MVGLTFVDEHGAERREAYIGRIREIRLEEGRFESLDDGSQGEMMLVECHDGEVREYPYDPDALEPADPGLYELPDGATIENPDYEMHWRIKEPAKH